jgi:hypothetical protein
MKCYDIDEPSPMKTPNIDALAKKGVKFWQAYAPAPTCAPPRCAIMNGNHPARSQKTHVIFTSDNGGKLTKQEFPTLYERRGLATRSKPLMPLCNGIRFLQATGRQPA